MKFNFVIVGVVFICVIVGYFIYLFFNQIYEAANIVEVNDEKCAKAATELGMKNPLCRLDNAFDALDKLCQCYNTNATKSTLTLIGEPMRFYRR